MSIIDERGRIFGRLNLVDAAVGMLLLVLLPAAYGAYLLFREPTPKLTGVYPSKLRAGPNLQVEVRGENFRPYMRVSFNSLQGRTFLFNNPKSAVVQLADIPAGKYDVILYDYMQEVARLPGGFTLENPPAPPTITVELSGVLTSLTPEMVAKIQPGHHFPEQGGGGAEVLSVGESEPEVLRIKAGDKSTITVPGKALELPVRVRTDCYIELTAEGALRCSVAGIPLGPDANVQYPGLGTTINLRVSEVHYPGQPRSATVHARLIMSPEVRSKLAAGDRDLGARAFPAGQMATLLSIVDRGDVTPAMLRDERVRQAIPTGRLVAADVVLKVPIEQTPVGWTYKNVVLKAGAPISFETATYVVDGGVTDVVVDRDERARTKNPAPVGR